MKSYEYGGGGTKVWTSIMDEGVWAGGGVRH